MTVRDINSALGRGIRKERRGREWSQQHLAELANTESGHRLNLAATTVNRIEHGKRKISAEEAVYLALALEMTLSELIYCT